MLSPGFIKCLASLLRPIPIEALYVGLLSRMHIYFTYGSIFCLQRELRLAFYLKVFTLGIL